jgi:hypothetical protein
MESGEISDCQKYIVACKAGAFAYNNLSFDMKKDPSLRHVQYIAQTFT